MRRYSPEMDQSFRFFSEVVRYKVQMKINLSSDLVLRLYRQFSASRPQVHVQASFFFGIMRISDFDSDEEKVALFVIS